MVEEEPYFLELVRYIHLNPVRAKILGNLSELDSFPYAGHSVLMGHRKFRGQDVEWVLGAFGRRLGSARKRYRDFVEAGFHQGPREDLRGGGLIRSAGGREHLALRSKDDWEKGDERILGGGDFVGTVLKSQPPLHSISRASATKILEDVCKKWEVQSKQILSRLRARRISQARRVFFLRAQEEAGESLTALARLCGVAHTSVLEAVEKAKIERQKG